MEDLFKVMGDALNPNCQLEADIKPIIDRQDAFDALLKAIDEITDMQIRINLRDRMIDYINSKY
jgi:hypothetical protein